MDRESSPLGLIRHQREGGDPVSHRVLANEQLISFSCPLERLDVGWGPTIGTLSREQSYAMIKDASSHQRGSALDRKATVNRRLKMQRINSADREIRRG